MFRLHSNVGKTMIASHIIRQYEIVRQLQTDALRKFNTDNNIETPDKSSGGLCSPSFASQSNRSLTSTTSSVSTSISTQERRLAHIHFSRDDLLRKIHSSKDVHNWVPFVALDKSDGVGFSAIKKIFKSMLLHTGEDVIHFGGL